MYCKEGISRILDNSLKKMAYVISKVSLCYEDITHALLNQKVNDCYSQMDKFCPVNLGVFLRGCETRWIEKLKNIHFC